MKFNGQKEAALVGYYPSVYSRRMIGHNPYPWQAVAMDWMAPSRARGLICTCNESGKTSHLVRDLILWHMDTNPGSLTVTTAGVNRQIGEQLYPYLYETCKTMPNWKVTMGNKYRVEAPNGSRCISFATNDPELAEGFHVPDRAVSLWRNWEPPEGWEFKSPLNDDTSFLFIADESKSIPSDIFQAIQRMNPPRLLICSSAPLEPTGFFVECFTHRKEWFKNKDGGYNIMGGMPEYPQISFRNCPHLWKQPEYVADAELERSINSESAFYMSMYEGLIPKEGSNMLFSMSAVNHSMSGHGIRHYGKGRPRAGVDLSNGGDEIPLFVANGNNCRLDSCYKEKFAPKLAANLVQRFEILQLRPEWVYADNTAAGDPIIDVIYDLGWPINRVDFNGKPIDPRYLNIRAEMLFELAMRINGNELILQADPILRKELSWHTYSLSEDGKLMVLKKKLMPNSPNRVDTLALMLYQSPRMKAFVKEENMRMKMLSPTMGPDANSRFETYSPTGGGDNSSWRTGGLFY